MSLKKVAIFCATATVFGVFGGSGCSDPVRRGDPTQTNDMLRTPGVGDLLVSSLGDLGAPSHAPAPTDDLAGTSGDCSASSQLIYVVDSQSNVLSSFTPNFTTFANSTFTDIGTVNCSVPDSSYTVFSMSVDRSGNAWVEYVSQGGGGRKSAAKPNMLFKVSTTDATCASTAFVGGQTGFQEFGMGFVNNPATMVDTLYVAGSASVSNNAQSTLGTLDLTTFQTTAVTSTATIAGNPELTGTGNGQLWAFIPGTSTSMPSQISQLSLTAGTESNTITASSIPNNAAEWAFAYYGGDFFVFLGVQDIAAPNGSDPTVIYHVTSAGVKESLDTSTTSTPRYLVGAGVSTCAPTVPPPPAT